MSRPTVRTVVSPVFGAPCHVLSVSRDAAVVDPGAGVTEAVLAHVAARGALRAAVEASGAARYVAPSAVAPFSTAEGEAVVEHGALRLRALHAPGHTPGSVLYVADGVVLTGDVLFAGSVGRTDLPGGDPAAMARTLTDVVGRLDPRLAVLPGHGPATTVAREVATNPFLRLSD